MTAITELKTYRSRLLDTVANIQSLRVKLADISSKVGFAQQVVEIVDTTGDIAGEIRVSIDKQLTVLKVTKNVGPLKLPSKVFEDILKAVKPVVVKIEDAVARLNGKQDTNGDGTPDGEGEFLDKLSNALTSVQTKLNAAVSELQAQEMSLLETESSISEFIAALEMANFDAFDGLKADVEGQMQQRNALTGELVDTFNGIVSKINGLLAVFSNAKVEAINADVDGVDEIADLLEVIGAPLNIAAAAIKPIEPLLDAVGFIFDLVVGPVIDFIIEKLGLDDLLDAISDEIKAFLPDADFLEPFIDGAQSLLDDLREFRDTAFGIFASVVGQPDFIDDIESSFYGATVGNALLGPTGFGDDSSELLIGDAGHDILDARAGDDQVFGNDGNDIIVASVGNDIANGGDGEDMIYFGGFFGEYELAKTGSDGNVIVTHVDPAKGKQNEGSETIIDIEHVVFRNISFTGAELENAIIGSSILNGTPAGDLMFLNSDGTPNSDGQHVANGLGGDDRIFGSTSDDQLNGGSGNDILIPGAGSDEANGSFGSDTFQILDNGVNNPNRIDLVAGTNFGVDGPDILNSIENLIVQGNGDHILTGDGKDNNIVSASGDDIVTGAGGNDTISTGAGKDVLFGGDGIDFLQGGDHNDFLVVGGAAVPGQGEFYDGGSGLDSLSYSQNRNIIHDVLNPEIDARNAIKNAMDNTTSASGAVRIFAGLGIVERLNNDGDVEATDQFEDVEILVGSDLDDVIHGTLGTFGDRRDIRGANGDDTLFSNGSTNVYGDDGNDLIVATPAPNGSFGSGINYNGGSGVDTLDLSSLGDVRWWFDLDGSISRSIRAFDEDRTGNLRSGSGVVFSANIESFEEILLGNGDHLIDNNPGGSAVRTFRTGDGDDELNAEGGFSIFHAGAGDDVAKFIDGGKFYAGAGDDRVTFDDTGLSNLAYLNSGNDYALLKRMKGEVTGGAGFDTLAFDIRENSRIDLDLVAGTAFATGTSSGGFTVHRVDAQIAGFEEVIGTNFNDTLLGSLIDDQFAGRAGNDVIQGRDGDDQLFGGAGNDTIKGNGGDDKLHGGGGNDIIDGGSGNDTLSYAYAAPDDLEGGLVAGNFGGVTVDLLAGTATGSFGSDTLMNISNVYGSGGNDTLNGHGGQNVLSGEEGNDTLNGRAGSDVLILGKGNDTADGGAGNDTIVLGEGSATIDGGLNFDTLELGTLTGKITLNFAAGVFDGLLNEDLPVWADTGTNEVRVFDSQNLTPELVREADPLFSNSFDDLTRTLPAIGSAQEPDFLIRDKIVQLATSGSFTGIEKVIGGSTSVNVILSAGLDRYDGRRSSFDIIDFSPETGSVAYNMATGATNIATAIGDDLRGMEGVRGGSGDDILVGDAGDNKLFGIGGNDTLTGAAGADVLNGGVGNDTADYRHSTAGVTVRLWNNTGLGGDAEGDILQKIENVTGSNSADTLAGDSAANVLDGRGGNDDLVAGSGGDTLIGGGGNDRLLGAGGADDLIGGNGKDTADYSDSTAGVSVRLWNGTGQGGEAQGDTLTQVENVMGSDHDDLLAGDSAANVLTGLKGKDTLNAGAGNDVLDGGIGADMLIGGSGLDTATYHTSNSGVTVRLWNNSGSGGQANNDTLDGIENVTGSNVGDLLVGDSAANVLNGLAGNDTLSGGGGGDTLIGGTGADMLIGGNGSDTADYQFSGAGVIVRLWNNSGLRGQAQGDTLTEIENVTGSNSSDTLAGDSAANVLDGRGGDDDLVAGSGGDTLIGGGGNDRLLGAGGADTLIGGNGIDTADYSQSGARVTVRLWNGTGVGGEAQGDTLTQVENVIGSNFADTLAGDSAANRLVGLNGKDVLNAGGGNDVLIGAAGADELIGGDGTDVADYSDSGAGVSVRLWNNSGVGGAANGDTLTEIENLIGSKSGDLLAGDSTANVLDGRAGNDTLNGGAGGDVLIGGTGADDLIGGGGTDTADYRASSTGVSVRLWNGSGLGGHAQGDTLTEIENVTGSSADDLLAGDSAANVLDGRGGNDDLVAGSGGDTLIGGGGNDRLLGAGGADILIGGKGIDTADYSDSAARVTVRLWNGTGLGGEAEGDMLSQIENITGSDFADVLAGDDGANVLNGRGGNDTLNDGSGNDTLIGGGGNDKLIGNAGADILIGGNGNDTADYRDSSAGVSVRLWNDTGLGGDAQGDTLMSIENVVGSGGADLLAGDSAANVLDGRGGNDALVAGAGGDTLIGGGGDDRLLGAGGADILIGGKGIDTADYSDSTARVIVRLWNGTGLSGEAEGDTLSQVENITGSDFADVLAGDSGANVLNGRGGHDALVAGSGNDTLIGGGGNDRLLGAGGADDLIGGNGIDTADYSDSTAGVSVRLWNGTGLGGEAQGDMLSQIENITGSNLADLLAGDSAANVLNGRGGNDALVAGSGGDTLIGGGGNDRLLGAGGADDLIGGNGIDTADYSDSTEGVIVRLWNGTGLGGEAQGDTLTQVENVMGSNSADVLAGDNGANVLEGFGGNDTINSGGGGDTLTGGGGNDTFEFGNGFGTNTITDFSSNNAEDIDLSAVSNITDFADLVNNHLVNAGGTAKIVDGANSILLQGVAFSDVGIGQLYSNDDFVF